MCAAHSMLRLQTGVLLSGARKTALSAPQRAWGLVLSKPVVTRSLSQHLCLPVTNKHATQEQGRASAWTSWSVPSGSSDTGLA